MSPPVLLGPVLFQPPLEFYLNHRYALKPFITLRYFPTIQICT